MRTWANIHLDHFLSNLRAVRARIGEKTLICLPVKADAYGHGALKIAETSLKAGVFCLGVASSREGTELREGGITAPILLMSQANLQEIPEIIKSSLSPFVSDSGFADALNEQTEAAKLKLPVHLKIDTGMGRIGCRPEDAASLAKHIASCAGLELAGTATHFAVSDSASPQDIAYTQAQIAIFNEALGAIRGAGIEPGIVHAANSGALILHPDSWFDMVRPGILLYGYKTAEEAPDKNFEPLQVKPVMELRTRVTLIKKVKKGESISYGRTWAAGEDTNVAVLAAGYADGLPRIISSSSGSVSGKWQALIGGKPYPLVGRICMDLCCVNLGPRTEVKRWDEAVLFGGEAKDASALAEAAGTIPYEVTCNVNKRVPRVY